jgi:hypothetical protein
MLRRVTLVKTDVWGERIASIIRVTEIGKLKTMLTVTSNRSMLRRNTSQLLTRATQRNISEVGIFHNRRLENLKSFIYSTSRIRFFLIFSRHTYGASLDTGVYSVSNRNECQKQKSNISGEEIGGRRVRLTTLPPSVSRLSR